MRRTYNASLGFDITNTYMIRMGEKQRSQPESYELTLTFLDRVKRHPDIEYVTLGNGLPYGGSFSSTNMFVNSDSLRYGVRMIHATSDFFKVFDIPLTSGRVFDWQDEGDKDKVIISSALNKNDFWGGPETPFVPVSQIHQLTNPYNGNGTVKHFDVIGTLGEYREAGFSTSTVFFPLQRKDVNLAWIQIAVRIKSGAEKDFPSRFRQDMKEQLSLGPYFLSSVEPLKTSKKSRAEMAGITGKINGIYAITTFLIINIFFGILGTFWFRTNSRRSEIGLRISLGSSKKGVQNMMVTETLLLLFAASIIGTIICLTVIGKDIISGLGIPVIDRRQWMIDWKQDVINYILTFTFLAATSVLAVLYPAIKGAKTQPAEALHEE